MRWHIYPFGLWLERPAGMTPDVSVLLIYDKKETLLPFANDWVARLPSAQFNMLTVDAQLLDRSSNELEQCSALIKLELSWTGLWNSERLILVGIGAGSEIAFRLAARCSSCAGVVACAAEFSIGDYMGVLAHTPLRLIQYAPQHGIRKIHPFERTVRRLKQQMANLEAIAVDAPLEGAANIIGAFGGNYLSDLVDAPVPQQEHAQNHSGQRVC